LSCFFISSLAFLPLLGSRDRTSWGSFCSRPMLTTLPVSARGRRSPFPGVLRCLAGLLSLNRYSSPETLTGKKRAKKDTERLMNQCGTYVYRIYFIHCTNNPVLRKPVKDKMSRLVKYLLGMYRFLPNSGHLKKRMFFDPK
jgi:hypothetical protein